MRGRQADEFRTREARPMTERQCFYFFSLFFRHIINTLILKEAVEDTLLNDKGLPAISAGKPVSGLNAAAFFCRRSKKCRNPFPASGKIADLEKPTVRLIKMVELRGVEPLSGKAVAKAATSVASIF